MFAYHFVKLVAVGILAVAELTTTAFFGFTEITVNLFSLCVCPLAELRTHEASTVATVQQTREQRHIAFGLAVGLGTVLIKQLLYSHPIGSGNQALVSSHCNNPFVHIPHLVGLAGFLNGLIVSHDSMLSVKFRLFGVNLYA